MGYVLSLWGKKPVAYVDGQRVVVEPVTASHVERCLAVYGMKLNMGIDEEVVVGGRTLAGYRVEVLKPDASEGYIVKAIEVCLGLLGIKAEKEVAGKVYELAAKKDISKPEEKQELGEMREEEIGLEPA